MWAIKPNGIGKPVGARAIQNGWPLKDGETFASADWTPIKVLAEDSVSLRDGTAQELRNEPTLDEIYDHALLTNKVMRALILALNDGTFVSGSNYTGAQIKTRIKSKMNGS